MKTVRIRYVAWGKRATFSNRYHESSTMAIYAPLKTRRNYNNKMYEHRTKINKIPELCLINGKTRDRLKSKHGRAEQKKIHRPTHKKINIQNTRWQTYEIG